MSSDETPRGLIHGFLQTSEINQSAVNRRTRQQRRSSQQPSLKQFLNESKRQSNVGVGTSGGAKQASSSSDSLTGARQSPSKRTHSTPKPSTPEVSARVAVRNRFLRSKGRAEGLNSARKRLQAAAKEGNDPTPRGLIQGFLTDAAPETPAIHRLDSPPTESFILPGIYNDDVINTQNNRALSPLVDTEIGVGSASRSAVRRKRKRQELNYSDFFSGIEKRMKTAGPRVEDDAAAELENDNDESTLEERAKTEVILSSSPDASITPLSRIHLQPDSKLPDFQISDAEDDESISGDESVDGNAEAPVVEDIDEDINDRDANEGAEFPDEEDGKLGSGEDHSGDKTAPPTEKGDGTYSGDELLEDPAEEDGNNTGKERMETEEPDEDAPDEENLDQDGHEAQEAVERTLQPTRMESNDIDSNLGDSLDATEDFARLQTPRISPRAHKTPVLTEQKQQRVQTKKKSAATIPVRKPRSGGAKVQPPLPTSLTKSIFSHFSTAKVSKEALAAVEKGSEQFFKRLTADLGAYCKHSHRQTIEMADIELLMKRQGLITSKQSLQSLIEQHLPMEYRRELIPVAYAGNIVKPKL